MKAIILCLLAFSLCSALIAAPFEQWFSGTSPKGAPVRVWGWGDEYSIRYEAEDGHAVVKEFVAGCIQTTGDLGGGFDGTTVGADRVTISGDGKVTISPADPPKQAEFFKIVLPKD